MICLRPHKLVTCYLRTRNAPNVRSENRLSSKSVRQIKNRNRAEIGNSLSATREDVPLWGSRRHVSQTRPRINQVSSYINEEHSVALKTVAEDGTSDSSVLVTLLLIIVACVPALLVGCTLGFPSAAILDLHENERTPGYVFDTLATV